MDITDNVAFVAAVLLVVTIILNAITLLVYQGRTAK
jgi:cytochrome c oxidase subunit 4